MTEGISLDGRQETQLVVQALKIERLEEKQILNSLGGANIGT